MKNTVETITVAYAIAKMSAVPFPQVKIFETLWLKRGYNIVTDGWAGAHNSPPLPPLSHTRVAYTTCVFTLFDSCITDCPTDGETKEQPNGQTNAWTDGWTNRRTKPLIELLVCY